MSKIAKITLLSDMTFSQRIFRGFLVIDNITTITVVDYEEGTIELLKITYMEFVERYKIQNLKYNVIENIDELTAKSIIRNTINKLKLKDYLF